MTRRPWLSGALSGYPVVCALAGAASAAQPPPPDVTVRTRLDRTAVWVADRLTYTIDITCARGVEVLADDLSRDKLKTEGLEVIGGDMERRSAPGEATIYQFHYVLTTYRIDAPTLKIAPLIVRYAVARAGQRLEDAAPAGEVQVPGATVGFRSVLPDDQDLSGIRSEKPPHARDMRFAALQPIGIGLVIVAAVPALLAIARLIRRSPSHVRRPARAVHREERASLEAVRTMEVETVEGRREVFAHLDALVREHLRDACGVAGASLTPKEIPFALATTRAKVSAEIVESVLATCELARYAPRHAIPSADACREVIDQVEQVIAVRGVRLWPDRL